MLTNRLKCILKYAGAETAADIGTDHAYIPIELIKRGMAKRVIASDVNKGPLEIAAANIRQEGFSDKIETRLGSGLSVLKKGEAGQIIIAGMGGELIQNSQYELRKYLMSNGFVIQSEDIAVEGFKVYNIMVVKKGEAVPFEKDVHYHIPPYLKDNENYMHLYAKKEREFKRVIGGLEKSENADLEKLEQYKNWLRELR